MTSILNNFNQSSYGKLFNSGYRLWQNNVIFGVGIKNFRVECDKQLEDILPNNPAQLCSTHPHNLYLELLSFLLRIAAPELRYRILFKCCFLASIQKLSIAFLCELIMFFLLL